MRFQDTQGLPMCVCVCVGVCACVLSCPRGQLRGVFSSVATGGMEQGDSVMGGRGGGE